MKTVIITGGSKGIGKAISKRFLKGKWKVLVGSKSKSDFVSEKHNNLNFCQIDVRKESDHRKIIKFAIDWSGSLDCFINCAGFSQWSPVELVNEDFWNLMIDTNLKGSFWGCKSAASHLNKGGSIINISSLAGKRGSSNNSVYCASKFGINGLTQSLAKELGSKEIRVNSVCPVYVETPGLLEALQNKDAPAKGQNIEKYLFDFANSNSALKRLPKGDEVAEICFFLASSKASAITGQCINVDCGVLPQ